METYTIYLGSKCNLSCSYCHRESSSGEKGISDSFVKKLSSKGRIRIKFMGGEPTLYMEDIKKVVEACPLATFAISTNGVLLAENIEFFKKHNFMICISYDGIDDNTRGFDPFLSECMKQDFPISVSCTLYHFHTDFLSIISKFAEKSQKIGKYLSFFPHIVHYTSINNVEYALTKEDCDSIILQTQNVLNELLEGLRAGVVCRTYLGIFRGFVRRFNVGFEYGETYCVNRNLKKFDANGNMFSCLYIRDDILSDSWNSELSEIIDSKFPKCRECPVYFMCGGACIKSIDHDIECYYYRKLYGWFIPWYKSNIDVLGGFFDDEV